MRTGRRLRLHARGRRREPWSSTPPRRRDVVLVHVRMMAKTRVMVALGLLLFFGKFYFLRVYLNRALEWLGIEPSF